MRSLPRGRDRKSLKEQISENLTDDDSASKKIKTGSSDMEEVGGFFMTVQFFNICG